MPVFYVSLLFVIFITLSLSFRGSDIQGFLHSGVLAYGGSQLCPGVVTSMGSYGQGFLCPGVLMSKDSYVQGLLCPGVISFRGSNPFPGVLTYITLSLSFRASDILGSLHPWVLTFKDSYVQGFFCPIIIISSGYYVQGLLHSWVLTYIILGPFIRGKIRRVLNKTQTFRINGTFRLK